MQTTITIKAHQCFHLRHIHLQQKGCEAAHCTAHNDIHPVRVFTRMATARSKAEMADDASRKSKEHCDIARIKAKEVAPEFHQPG